jgi:hypothetical protein
MRPTRPSVLLAVALVTAALSYLLAELAYGSLPELPAGAPVPLAVLAVVELVLAKVVRDRVQRRRRRDGRPPQRRLHPMQVARAAALAKASSAAGALLLGLYAGAFVWTAQRADTLAAASDDVLVSGLSALASAGLIAAALVLERACRVPTPPDAGLDGERGLGSAS